MAKEVIRLDSVSKQFGGIEAVRSVSFTVYEGETFGLIGTSGSGKTTTLRMINRLIEPGSGTIRINGEDILEQDPVRLRRHIGYMIQNVGLFPHRTIGENVATVPRLLNWDLRKIREAVRRNLELVGLEPDVFINRHPHELSGGQQQRAGLARALAADPPVILLDEPFAASDPISRRDLIGEFKKLRKRVRKTMVLVTHDIPESFELCNRLALLDHGSLQQTGTREDLLFRPVNDFVHSFFRSQRLTLELSVIPLNELLSYLDSPQDRPTEGLRIFAPHQSAAEVLAELSLSPGYDGFFCIGDERRLLKVATGRDLFEAVLKYRGHQTREPE